MKFKQVMMSAALLAPLAAQAQFVTGPNGITDKDKPWDKFQLNPKTRVKVDFRNSNVDNVIAFLEKYTGVTMVKDPTLTGGITMTSAKPVSLSDALQIFMTTLSLKGFDLTNENNLLVIRGRKQNNNQPAWDMSQIATQGQDQGQQSVAKVYPILYANASQLARVVNDVFTPTTTGQNPFARFGQGGFGGNNNRNFGGGFGGNQGGNRFQGGGNNNFQFPFNFNAQQGPNVKASSDDFSNSVVVYGPQNDQRQVADLIKSLDQPTTDLLETQVFKLKYAISDNLVSVVQNVLTSNPARGRGGATTTQTQGPGAFLSALRGSTPGSGQVTSDPHTNSLIVTATPDNVKLCEKVIHDLDTEVKIQTSTFVFPLRNARSDLVQQLLQSAFGTRQGVSNSTNRNTTIQAVTPSTKSTTSTNSSTGARLPGSQNLGDGSGIQASNLPVDLADPSANSGELQTNIAVAQGFGGFGGGGQRTGGGSSSTSSQVGNGTPGFNPTTGQVVNVHDLTGQVTAISDPNTNSIIVVTTPENADMVKNILDQLDKIPEQVMIETVVTEATLDKNDQLGVEYNWAENNVFGLKGANTTLGTNWGLAASNATTPLQGGVFTLSSGNLTAFLNVLQTDTTFKVLSTPRIFTSNNVEADINISQSVPYITSTTVNPAGGVTNAYAFLDVGIVLTVNPHISSNGYVTMDVTQTANDLQGFTSYNAPIVNQRVADTTVSVKDGETVILGGMIRQSLTATVNKVPLLGDLPFFGNLFRNTTHAREKTELLLFLTPHIVRDPAEAKRLKDDSLKELSKESYGDLKSFPSTATNPSLLNKGGEPPKPGGN